MEDVLAIEHNSYKISTSLMKSIIAYPIPLPYMDSAHFSRISWSHSSIILQKSQPSLPMNKVGSHHVENFCYYDILELF